MPSFSVSHQKQTKSAQRPSTSLLRRFHDMYKPSTTRLSSPVPKVKAPKTKTLFNVEQPVHVSLFHLDTEAARRGESC
jgi:hypothetical protein